MKPMLAAATDGKLLTYPLLLSPKLDGVRCLILDGVAMSRSLKPIPNNFVQQLLGRPELNGLDGELIVGPSGGRDVYQRTMSGVMSRDGEPDVKLWVFDDFTESGGFEQRLRVAHRRIKRVAACEDVPHHAVAHEEDLLQYEEDYLELGYEGVMLRRPEGPYKHGRSTAKEAWLLKLKRFTDSEAVVLGATCLMTNHNEAVRNKLGHLERSSHKAGKLASQLLGAFQVRDVKTGVEFEIGTGFDAGQRRALWAVRSTLVGKLVKYKSQPIGVKDKPRFPVFLGFRDPRDL